MRQAVEAQVLNPHCELGEHGLRQILTDVIEEVRQSVSQDIDGAEVLHSLLNAPWLQSLLKVYECLQRYLRGSPAPALDYASGLSLQLLIDIRSLSGCSEDAKELYRLLRQPHLQALLSAHDTVAQKDYEPVLPPMPDELPDDEEATRIVCLVKNKQPLLTDHRRPPAASPPCARRLRGVRRSHWDTLRRFTMQGLHRVAESHKPKDSLLCRVRRGSYPPTEPPCRPAGPRPNPPPPQGQPTNHCRLCYTNLLWEQSLNRSAPSVYSSVLIDNVVEELDSADEDESGRLGSAASSISTGRRWTMSPPCLTVPYCDYLPPGLPRRFPNPSPRIRTAPPSPMRPHRVLEVPPVELAKQESLDELRSTVQLAASSMESSTKDIKLLGERMAAATERMSETVQDNSQALVLLTQVVDRLQTLLTATRTELDTLKPPESKKSPKSGGHRPSLTHQSRCSLLSPPSFTSSSSSSSLSSYMEAPSTSKPTRCRSVSCQGSPRTTPKAKNALKKKHSHSDHPLTNGLLDEPKEAKGGGSIQQRKKKKKKRKKTT